MNGQGESLGLAKMRNWEQTVNLFDNIIVDRGSKYSVSGAPVLQDEVQQFLKTPERHKKYAKATHNTWAVHFRDAGPRMMTAVRAGLVIVRMLERQSFFDHLIVVTRWFGGTNSGRSFSTVQDCVNYYLNIIIRHLLNDRKGTINPTNRSP